MFFVDYTTYPLSNFQPGSFSMSAKNERHTYDFLRSCFGLSLNTGIGTSSEVHELFVTARLPH
jgi:hypothetical protein